MPKVMAIVLLFSIIFCNICISQQRHTEEGIASYYHHRFHGKATASGELYDKDKFTGAHKKLPFGSKVKVTNLANQKSVVVIINERGPYTPGRVIDISYAAAERIDMIKQGVAKVRVETLE